MWILEHMCAGMLHVLSISCENAVCHWHNVLVTQLLQILNTLQVPYETVNILEDELLRSGMKEYSQWPTFPQVYVDGEFIGGCDILIGNVNVCAQDGQLQTILQVTVSLHHAV